MFDIRLGAAGAVAAVLLALQPAFAQRSLFDQPLSAEPVPAATAQASPQRPAAPPTPTQSAQAAPAAEAPAAKPKPRARKASGPVPAKSLTINNASPNALTSLEVSGDGKTAKLSKPLASKKKATLKLPAFKTCTVSVAASFEGQPAGETSELDICKEKAVRFTE